MSIIGDKEVKPQANATEPTDKRQEYLDTHHVGDNRGVGCREVVLGTMAIVLLMLSLLSCGLATSTGCYSTYPGCAETAAVIGAAMDNE